MKKRLIVAAAVCLAALATMIVVRTMRSPSVQVIGVVQFVHQPLLDETYRGLIAELDRLGLNDGTKFRVETQVADKDVQVSGQITRQFLDHGAILIVAIATPSAQAAAAQTTEVPIVFAAITDPVAAKLVDSLARPGRNLTGTSNRWPFEKQVPLIPRLVPNAKVVGAIWNPGEANSQAAMSAIRPLLAQHGLKLVEAPVATTADVASAARSIADKIDVFLMIPDNTTLAATPAIVQVALDTKKPLLGGDMDTVRKGSIASFGYDYVDLGRVTAQMVKEILLDGKTPGQMPVRYPLQTNLILNERTAKTFEISFPEDLKREAVEVVK